MLASDQQMPKLRRARTARFGVANLFKQPALWGLKIPLPARLVCLVLQWVGCLRTVRHSTNTIRQASLSESHRLASQQHEGDCSRELIFLKHRLPRAHHLPRVHTERKNQRQMKPCLTISPSALLYPLSSRIFALCDACLWGNPVWTR